MRGTKTVTVELEIPSSIGMLETADVVVEHVAASAGFDLDSCQAIQVALHEALVNAIVHGNDEDETRRVNVELAAVRMVSPSGSGTRGGDSIRPVFRTRSPRRACASPAAAASS
jgi:Histidine kinase-like ATPase domain